MGLIGAAFGLGFVFGPPAGGLIKSYWGVEYVGYIVAGICLVNFIVAYFILPESLKEKNRSIRFNISVILPVDAYVNVFRKKGIRELFLIWFIYVVAFFVFQITISIFWKEQYKYNDEQIGYIFAFSGLCTAIMQGGLLGWFTRKFGERKLLLIGPFTLMITLSLMSYIPGHLFIPLGLLTLLFLSIANGMVRPSSLSLLSQMTDPQEQGKTMGLFQSFGSMAQLTGFLIGSWLYGLNIHAPYWVGATILLISLYLARIVYRTFRPRKEELGKETVMAS